MVVAARITDTSTEDIACRGKILLRTVGQVMRIVPSKRNVSLLSYFLALRCRIKVNAHLAGSLLSLRTVGRRPVALTSRFSCFVLVIQVAEYRDS